jgi:hypothetical protein
VPIGLVDIALENAEDLCGDRAPHDGERINREERLTGKNGLRRKLVIRCRSIKRVISRCSYSSLFLMPAKLSPGDRLPVSLKTPQ